MELCHFINLMALVAAFVFVIVVPAGAWLTKPKYRAKLRRAYNTRSEEPSPPLPPPAVVVRCPSYRVYPQVAKSRKYKARRSILTKKGRK